MFFDLIILQRQNKGRLQTVWLAATRGIKHLDKKTILEADVPKLCRDVEVFLCSESQSPRERFSLRFSSLLVNGIIRVHGAQVSMLLEAVTKLYIYYMAPLSHKRKPPIPDVDVGPGGQLLFDTDGSPPIIGVRRPKTKKPKKAPETPESQLARIIKSITEMESPREMDQLLQNADLEAAPGVVARADEITLREELPRHRRLSNDEEMGVMAVDDIDAFPRFDHDSFIQIRDGHQLSQDKGQSLEQEPFLLPLPKRAKKLSGSSPDLDQHRTFTVEALVHAPADEYPDRPPEETADQNKTQPPLRAPEIVEELIDVDAPKAPKAPKEKPARGKKQPKKPAKKANNIFIVSLPKTRKMKPLDRCKLDDFERVSVQPLVVPQQRIKLSIKTGDLLEKYFMINVTDGGSLNLSAVRQRQTASTSLTAEDSHKLTVAHADQKSSLGAIGEVPRSSGRGMSLEPMQLDTTHAFGRPVTTSTPFITPKRPRQEEITTENQPTSDGTEAVAAEEIGSPPVLLAPKRRKIVDDRQRRPDLGEIAQEIQFQDQPGPPAVQTDDPIQKRHKYLIYKLLERDTGLTLEEICPPPLSKFSVARCFTDLLNLCKAGYVSLIPEDDSIELKLIKKGPKFDQFLSQ